MTDKELAKESWWNDDCCSGAMTTEKIYECGFLAGLKACEEKIELMKCCQNCKHFDFDEPKYCHKGVYNCAYSCDKWELGN